MYKSRLKYISCKNDLKNHDTKKNKKFLNFKNVKCKKFKMYSM